MIGGTGGLKMAGKMNSCLRFMKENARANVIVGILFLFVVWMAAELFLTNDKEPQAVSAPVKVVNEEFEVMEANPLTENLDGDAASAVMKYYERQGENSDFVESYENLSVYMKKGKYQNTYIAFVKYDMKIKGIYTPVPGLGTLYVDKDDKGKVRVNAKVDDAEIQKYIAAVTGQEDVQALFQEVEASYKAAVQSDAMLAEAVNDLESAAAGQ